MKQGASQSLTPLVLAGGSPVDSMLRAALVECWPTLKWRHHGIGALQAYIREHTDPEIRVHVWSPRLVRPGIIGHGNAHDHRFDLTSYVLAGALTDTRYAVQADVNGDWSVHLVENARSAGPEKNYDGEHSGAMFHGFVELDTLRIDAGSSYWIPRGDFHSTESAEPLTITVCAMSKKKGLARLLVPRGEDPVHAFGEEFLAPGELVAIVSDARDLLSGIRNGVATSC